MVDFTIPFTSALMALQNLVPSAVKVKNNDLTKYLRECFCKFQLDYSNYSFRFARLHRDFKISFLQNGVERETDRLYEELIRFSEAGLGAIYGAHADYIAHYFSISHRNKIPPRVSVHIMGKNKEIVNLAMISGSGRREDEKQVDEYTFFKKVVDTGVPYIDNNLPKTLKTECNYMHSGIDLDAIRKNHKNRIVDKFLISRLRGNIFRSSPKDDTWSRFWVPDYDGNDIIDCYKSLLVVPITFRKHAKINHLSQDLVNILSLKNEGRAILGFILADHPYTYYFDESPADSFDNIDVNIIYLFADTLSLAIVTSLTYIDGSSAVTNYKQQRWG